MEELKKLVKALGVPQATIDALTADTPPEDFDASKAIKEAVAEREQFFVQKNKKAIEEAYEEEEKGKRYAATVNPLINRYAKIAISMGATSEEVKDLNIKELADLIDSKKDEAISAASKTGDEELRKQVNEYKAKWSAEAERAKELEAAKPLYEKEVEQRYAEQFKATKIDNKFGKMLQGEKFKGIKNVGKLDKVLKLYLQEAGYKIDLDENENLRGLMAKDGTAAINLEGNRVYDNFEDLAVDVARANDLFPAHNGGEGGPKLSSERIINGEKKSVGEGANWLKSRLNA